MTINPHPLLPESTFLRVALQALHPGFCTVYLIERG